MTFDLKRSLWAAGPVLVASVAFGWVWLAEQQETRQHVEQWTKDRELLFVHLLAADPMDPQALAERVKRAAARTRSLAYVAVVGPDGSLEFAWVAKEQAEKALGQPLPSHSVEAVRRLLASQPTHRMRRYRLDLPDRTSVRVGFLAAERPRGAWWWVALAVFLTVCAAVGAGLTGRKTASEPLDKLRKALMARGVPSEGSLEDLLERAAETIRTDGTALKLLEPFLPRAIYDRLRQGKKLGGEERAVAVLAIRLQGVEALFETHSAQKLLDLVNTHLDPILQVLLQRDAVVGILGLDGLVCWWGAPKDVANAEEVACQAAMEVRRALFELHRRQQTIGSPILHVGIGLAAGRCLLGRVGSLHQMAPVLVGRAVEQAVRLSRVAAPEEILLSASAARLLSGDAWRMEALSAPGDGDHREQVWRLLASK